MGHWWLTTEIISQAISEKFHSAYMQRVLLYTTIEASKCLATKSGACL